MNSLHPAAPRPATPILTPPEQTGQSHASTPWPTPAGGAGDADAHGRLYSRRAGVGAFFRRIGAGLCGERRAATTATSAADAALTAGGTGAPAFGRTQASGAASGQGFVRRFLARGTHTQAAPPADFCTEMLQHYEASRGVAKDFYKRHYSTHEAAHEQEILKLAADTSDRIPFPCAMPNPSSARSNTPETVVVQAEDFELAKLVDKVAWMGKSALTRGSGSETKGVDAFASRFRSCSRVRMVRMVADKYPSEGLVLPAFVFGSGNCAENAVVTNRIIQSMNEPLFRALGVTPLPSIKSGVAEDQGCDHAATLCHLDGATDVGPDGAPRLAWDRTWVLDSHQLYPMPLNYRQAWFGLGHDHHTSLAVPITRVGSVSMYYEYDDTNFAHAATLRADLEKRLKAGQGGLSEAIDHAAMRRLGIRSEFVDKIVAKQRVASPAQVNRNILKDHERRQFENEMLGLQRELGRRLLGDAYRTGQFPDKRYGLYAPKNPAVVYKNADTDELLVPTVPPSYLETTESRRWAYEKWKQTRPEREAVDAGLENFTLHPAVELIETNGFMRALAAARALDFSANTFDLSQVRMIERAHESLQDWIARMDGELTPELGYQIQTMGLGEEVIESVGRARSNHEIFRNRLRDFLGKTQQPEAGPANDKWTRLTALLEKLSGDDVLERLDDLVSRTERLRAGPGGEGAGAQPRRASAEIPAA